MRHVIKKRKPAVEKPLVFFVYDFYLFFSTSCIFIARTLHESPYRLMKPSASWWSYKSPVVKEAIDSLYSE
jgi:hypothetical protein